MNQKAQASGDLSAYVSRLFATAENDPDLKANNTFLQLQKRIAELENDVADRREFYNDAINLFNRRIQQMPETLVATLIGLTPRELFQVKSVEKAALPVALNAAVR